MIVQKLSSLNIPLTGKSFFSRWKYEPFPTCIPLDVEIRQKIWKKLIFGKVVGDKKLTPIKQAVHIISCQVYKQGNLTRNGCKL